MQIRSAARVACSAMENAGLFLTGPRILWVADHTANVRRLSVINTGRRPRSVEEQLKKLKVSDPSSDSTSSSTSNSHGDHSDNSHQINTTKTVVHTEFLSTFNSHANKNLIFGIH